MNAQCAKCGTQIRIDESKLGERGARIRCPRCAATVVVERPGVAINPGGGLELDFDLSGSAAPPPAPATVPIPRPNLAQSAAAAKTAPRPVAASRPAAPAPGKGVDSEPELISDDDLVFAEADMLAEAGPGAPGKPTSAKGPDPVAPARANPSVVAPPPQAARSAAGAGAPVGVPREPPPGGVASPTAGDEQSGLMLSGGLAADGTFTAPAADMVKTRALKFGAAEAALLKASASQPEPGTESLEPASEDSDAAPPPDGVTRVSQSPRSVLALIANSTASVLLVLVLALGVLTFIAGGRIDYRLLHLDRQALFGLWKTRPLASFAGVQVAAMRSTLYPTHSGTSVLAFLGEVKNTSTEPRQRLLAVAELRDASGRVVASERAPVGIALGPSDLVLADDAAALAAVYQSRLKAEPSLGTLAPGASAPFAVVMVSPPPQLEQLQHEVTLVFDTSPRVESPPPPQPTVATDVPEDDRVPAPGKARAKGKGKLKGKARPREAADGDDEPTGGSGGG